MALNLKTLPMLENPVIRTFKKRADKIVAKVQAKINRLGAYENAGQDEINYFMSEVSKARLHYQEECTLKDYINVLVDNLDYSK